jgi:hypothetical protein
VLDSSHKGQLLSITKATVQQIFQNANVIKDPEEISEETKQ